MQGDRFDIIAQTIKHAAHPLDFTPARQESQDVTFILTKRLHHRTRKMLLDVLLRACGRMDDIHGKAPTCTGQPRRTQPLRNALAIQRRRHDDDTQVGAQRSLHIERQCGSQIAREVALVKFVEEDRTHAFQRGVVLDHPAEDAFGDHFDACPWTRAGFEPDPVAHGFAHLFATLSCHERRRSAGCDTAWFQHEDAQAGQPRCVQQRQRHLGGLAGAGRGFEDKPGVPVQRIEDVRKQGRDGKVVGHTLHIVRKHSSERPLPEALRHAHHVSSGSSCASGSRQATGSGT